MDNSVSSEELETTIEHEINERNLMNKFGMTYFDAHDSSLSLEINMRRDIIQRAKEHETSLPMVSPIDFDSTQEITDIPDKIKLINIYRQFYKTIDGYDIWIVDGANVRRDIYPDFGFSGNYLAYKFIPENEIWIEAQISCEELIYSIKLELLEINELKKGKYYDNAYEFALNEITKLRKSDFEKIKNHSPLVIKPPLIRDTGTGKQ